MTLEKRIKLLSLRLRKVEILEWVSQKVMRMFHFSNLVTFLVSEISQKTGFNCWYEGIDLFTSLRQKTTKIILLLRKLNMIIVFTLINSFTCFFKKT